MGARAARTGNVQLGEVLLHLLHDLAELDIDPVATDSA